MRVILKATLRDTQALKYNEGCTYNGLILTQKVGERLEVDLKTFCVFIDLCKAFDTVNKRLLWARLRSLGVYGKLLRALRAGYGKRKLIGKLGDDCSTEKPDVGLGVRQGEVDSSDAFAAFIDDLDCEIERREETLGRKLGIALVGTGNACAERVATLKHADDTVILASSEEDLQILLEVITIWCRKWQITPQALKCECMVFENTGMTCPTLQFAGAVLPVVQSVLYLGYQLSHRGTWKQHVDRRVDKADKWDGVARAMLGKTGGPPVSVVATVRDATAEAGILYGAEFTGGTGTTILAAAAQRQVEMAKEILGLRASAENVGAMLELGWMGIESKAKRARLMFWWRLGRTESALMQQLEKQAHEHKLGAEQITKSSQYNWWRATDDLVEHMASISGYPADTLRAMSKQKFRRVINHILWREEFDRRVEQCQSSTRLESYVAELQHLAEEDAVWGSQRTKWPGAPYLA